MLDKLFENLGFNEWRTHLKENPRTNPAMIEHLLGLARVLQTRNPIALANTVQQVTGSRPMPLTEFVRKHCECLPQNS